MFDLHMISLLLVGSRVPNPQVCGPLLKHYKPRPLGGLRAGSTRGATGMAISYLSAEEVKAILEGCVSPGAFRLCARRLLCAATKCDSRLGSEFATPRAVLHLNMRAANSMTSLAGLGAPGSSMAWHVGCAETTKQSRKPADMQTGVMRRPPDQLAKTAILDVRDEVTCHRHNAVSSMHTCCCARHAIVKAGV